MPLADKIRPSTLDDVVGQSHLIGKNQILRRLIVNNTLPNMIFFGPPGVGKTTVANIIANTTNKKLFKLNATTASTKDIQDIIKELNSIDGYNGLVLYLDEIQNFNKRQQQSLLSYIETGEITLISSTTENPYFSIYGAILSRCLIFEFKPLSNEDISKGLVRAIKKVSRIGRKITYEDTTLDFIASLSKGDLRKSLLILETILNTRLVGDLYITLDMVKELSQETLFIDESKYYDWISMLQKSIRGSDTDASVLALGLLLKAGKFDDVIRRLLVIASEDCGLAMGGIYSTFFSLINSAKMVGMPEAQIILSHAVILLSSSPKSNSAYKAIKTAMSDIENKNIGEIQHYLRDSHYSGASKLGVNGYKYPHDYPNNYVEQEYMPENMKGTIYYEPGNNKYERALVDYWRKIKNN